MRYHEFRQWDSIHKCFQYSIGVHDGQFVGPSLVPCAEFPLEEYSGITDRHGRHLFEQDIVMACYGIPPRTIVAVVEFHGGAFIVRTPGHHPEVITLFMLKEALPDLEKIGNTHEDGRLLA